MRWCARCQELGVQCANFKHLDSGKGGLCRKCAELGQQCSTCKSMAD